MKDRIQQAFDQVQAGQALKQQTRSQVLAAMAKRRQPRWALPRLAPAVLTLFLFLMGGGSWLYLTPVTTISVDINPSLELGVNRFGQVVQVDAYNDDGQQLADSLDLKYRSYGMALEEMLASDTIDSLLQQDALLSIAVVGGQEAQRQEILEQVARCTQGRQNVDCYSLHQEDVAEAHALGLSYGKYRAYLDASAVDDSLTVEQAKGMTMRQLHSICDGSHHSQGQAASDDSGNAGKNSGQNAGTGSGNGTPAGAASGQGAGYGHHREASGHWNGGAGRHHR